jgi:uncharacterized membrane protein YgcG
LSLLVVAVVELVVLEQVVVLVVLGVSHFWLDISFGKRIPITQLQWVAVVHQQEQWRSRNSGTNSLFGTFSTITSSGGGGGGGDWR